MRKNKTIILLDKQKSYEIVAYGGQAVYIQQEKYSRIGAICILGNGKISFKEW